MAEKIADACEVPPDHQVKALMQLLIKTLQRLRDLELPEAYKKKTLFDVMEMDTYIRGANQAGICFLNRPGPLLAQNASD